MPARHAVFVDTGGTGADVRWAQQGVANIEAEFVKDILKTFEAGKSVDRCPGVPPPTSASSGRRTWSADCLIKEIESWAGRHGRQGVDSEAIDAVNRAWKDRGVFHLDLDDPCSRY